MGFCKKHIVLRRAAGSGAYDDDGVWQPGGGLEEMTIKASVQPANMDEVDALPSGARLTHTVKIYTATELYPAKQAAGGGPSREADILLYRGEQYKIVACAPYQSGVIDHFKSFAQEVDAEHEPGTEEIRP